MTLLRFSRIAGDQPCQHPDCRKAPKGPQMAAYKVTLGERIPLTRTICVNHAAALAAEHGQPFPPVGEGGR